MQTRIISISRSNYYGYGSVGSGAIEPVSLAEAKEHCRVDFTDDDSYITKLITQCRKRIENYCSISIIPQTITTTLSFQRGSNIYSPVYGTNLGVPYGTAFNVGAGPRMEIPYGPVMAMISVTSVGQDNSISILDPTNQDFYVRGTGYQFLAIENCPWNNAILCYTAGYAYGTVPEDLKLALLEEIAFRFEQRGDNVNRYANQNVGISEASQAYLTDYVRLSWL